jgi:hypothetical protein
MCTHLHTFLHTLFALTFLCTKCAKTWKNTFFRVFYEKTQKWRKPVRTTFQVPQKAVLKMCVFSEFTFHVQNTKKVYPYLSGSSSFFWCFWDDFFSLLHLNRENSPIKWQKKCPGNRDPKILGLDLGHISFLSNTDVLFFNKPRLIFLCFETWFFHVFHVWWFFFIIKKWWKKTEAKFTFQKWLFTFSHFLPKSSKMAKVLTHFIKK